MIIVGLALFAVGFLVLWMALPRGGRVRSFVGNEAAENLVCLAIMLSWVAGAALFLAGLI